MKILLTNDDGIFAPGLAAMHQALTQLGDVSVVAPATEQSGVGHSITFLTPLMAKEVFDTRPDGSSHRRGWAVEGSPADCVKLALAKFVDGTPDLVVSGINGGLNVGINVLYSGTVAAASEAALNDLPSIAVSLEYDDHPRFDRAAILATEVIRMMLKRNAWDRHLLFNLNMPTSLMADSAGIWPIAGTSAPELQQHQITQRLPELLKVAPMNVTRWAAEYDERRDPKNRRYYWAAGTLAEPKINCDSDLAAIRRGEATLTPLTIDRTRSDLLEEMRGWIK